MQPQHSGFSTSMPSPDRIELPPLSAGVKIALQNNQTSVLGKALAEVAIYYHQKYPDMKHSSYYQSIGRLMIREYPCLAHEGPKPWVGQRYFTLFGVFWL